MVINIEGTNIKIEHIEDFSLSQTLECGQCFHFDKINEDEYVVIAKGRILHVKQKGDTLWLYETTEEEYETIWKEYFDLDRNYQTIKEMLLSKDQKLKEAIDEKWGIHILNQDFFEMLISFIISQNKQIPHIKQIVFGLSNAYGEFLGNVNGKNYYSFPNVEFLVSVSEDEFRELKTGFRAPYLVDACNKISSGEIVYDELLALDCDAAMKELMKIKGIGEKVAHCILLFGLSKREAFPVDVWIKRIMEELYFEGDTKKEEILRFALEHFGELGGYAQQYLFYYARSKKDKKK